VENAQVVEGEKALSWRRRFVQFERSGLSQIKFCRQHGIALSSFTWWKRRLKLRTADRPAFIPVQLKEEAARTAPIGAWACEIVGSQVKLRLRELPDAAGLRELTAIVTGEA
jgi:hypothetical protein